MGDSQSSVNPNGGDALRRGAMQPALHEDLMARVVDRANMQRASKQVKVNRGAPGVDGMPIENYAAFARSHWAAIRQALCDGSYFLKVRPSFFVLRGYLFCCHSDFQQLTTKLSCV